MVKKILLGTVFAAVVVVLVVGAVQRASASAGESVAAGTGRGQGGVRWSDESAGSQGVAARTSVAVAADQAVQHVDLAALTPGTLSEDEVAGLVYMREEEKLARDVYLALYTQWGQAVFQNIASSEQTHMDTVLDLLQGYGVADPAGEQGQFTNPDLQALYDQLVAQGSQSLADALKVGATIEEIDIADLRERMTLTDENAIQTVYASLESGSENHLRAFTSTLLRQTGETYQPQYLSVADYQAIIGSETGSGQGVGGNGYRGGR